MHSPLRVRKPGSHPRLRRSRRPLHRLQHPNQIHPHVISQASAIHPRQPRHKLTHHTHRPSTNTMTAIDSVIGAHDSVEGQP